MKIVLATAGGYGDTSSASDKLSQPWAQPTGGWGCSASSGSTRPS